MLLSYHSYFTYRPKKFLTAIGWQFRLVAFYGSYLTRVKVCKLPLCYVAKQWLATMLYQELSLPPSSQPKLPIKCQVIINPVPN